MDAEDCVEQRGRVGDQREFHFHVAGTVASPEYLRVQEVESVPVVVEGDGRKVRRAPLEDQHIPLCEQRKLCGEGQGHSRD